MGCNIVLDNRLSLTPKEGSLWYLGIPQSRHSSVFSQILVGIIWYLGVSKVGTLWYLVKPKVGTFRYLGVSQEIYTSVFS